jgi:putative transposase
MTYNPEIHHRRSIRLEGYDYSQAGAYFVTVCVKDHACLFGDVEQGEMILNEYGHVVTKCWYDLTNHYAGITLDAFIVMPNHIHCIIVINNDVGAGLNINVGAGFKPAPTDKRHGLSEIVRAFKTFSSRYINQIRNTPGIPVWQRNYYEHVIRTEKEFNQIREYIVNNPIQWELDTENPQNTKGSKLKNA